MTRKARDEAAPDSDATEVDGPVSDEVILDVVTPEALLAALRKAAPSEEDDVAAPPHPHPRDS